MTDETQQLRPLAQAAAWRVRLTEDAVESCEPFDLWLCADPEHAAAWAKVQAMWSYFDEQAEQPEMLALRDEILAQARPTRIAGDSQF